METDMLIMGIKDGLVICLVVMVGFHFYKKLFRRNRNKTKTLRDLGFGHLIPQLNDYEISISAQLIDPSQIEVTFKDIAGMHYKIRDIKKNIILPLLIYPLMKSRYFEPPMGVLLYGPPGCGKTMIAKAIAKEANARFINLEIPTVTDKWYGESQKYAQALFTLAKKVQPCIIFIDEIDTFLRSRDSQDHEVTAMIKAQFMILWDGLTTGQHTKGVIVLGATNRPLDVDPAILRRMPTKFEIPLPDHYQRKVIIRHLLKKAIEDKIEFSDTMKFEFIIGREYFSEIFSEILAEKTEHFSGSDLKELVRNALFRRLGERSDHFLNIMKSDSTDKIQQLNNIIIKLRKVTLKDFIRALSVMKK